MAIPKRIAGTVMTALRGGTVPRVGLEYMAVGRKAEIEALLHDIDIVEDGGAMFRFVVGKYGSGKSFMLQTIRNHVMERGFVVADADLSIERRLTGNQNQGLATYRELIKNIATKTSPDGGALSLILEKWIMAIQKQAATETGLSMGDPEIVPKVDAKIYENITDLSHMVHGFDFAKVISGYWTASKSGNDEGKNMALRWLRGEYATKTEAKKDLGVNAIISDEDWYDYLKLLSTFLVNAGYKGLLILLDEIINIYKIPNKIARNYNYEKILTMYNDALQGRVSHVGIIMGGTPDSIYKEERGLFSYEALKSRLQDGRFSSDTGRNLLSPLLALNPLTHEELFVLIEKLAEIHADLYAYTKTVGQNELVAFLKVEFNRLGAESNITPRDIIKDFIGVLDILFQDQTKTMAAVLGGGSFEFSKDDITDEKIHETFAEFTL